MKEWKVFDESKEGRDSISILEKSDREGQVYRDVAQLIFHDKEGYEKAREYARLIATAPELLDALEEAIIEFEGLPHSLGYESTHLYKWRAAIAKARE